MRIRHILLRALLAVFLLVPSACGALRSAGSTDEVRVLVYNIHAGKDAKGIDNLARVADIIRASNLSYPADKPVKRIDYLLLPSDWKCVSARVIETEASDHRPVLFVIWRAR